MIWVGVGAGKGFHPSKLGQTAAQEAMEQLGKKRPDLLIVFSSSRLDQKEILQGVLSVTGATSLIGCSGVTQITGKAVDEDVVVVSLVSNTFRVQKGLGRGLREDGRKAGQEAAWAATRDLKEKGRFFLAFSDGLSGKGDDAIRGMQEVLGTSFPIIGASGADSFRFEKSFQYYDAQVLQDSLCGALFFGNLTFGIGSHHGWCPLGRSRRVTRAAGNTVERLDDKPAISIYEDYFGENFHQSGEEPLTRKTLFYPLGLLRGKEEWLIRQPLRVGPGGALICGGEVSEGAEVRLMIGTKDSFLEATQKAGRAALKGLGGKKPRLVLVFESASRKKILGHDALQELKILHDLFGEETPIAGCYDYGEKFPLENEEHVGQSCVLNASVVLLALGE